MVTGKVAITTSEIFQEALNPKMIDTTRVKNACISFASDSPKALFTTRESSLRRVVMVPVLFSSWSKNATSRRMIDSNIWLRSAIATRSPTCATPQYSAVPEIMATPASMMYR